MLYTQLQSNVQRGGWKWSGRSHQLVQRGCVMWAEELTQRIHAEKDGRWASHYIKNGWLEFVLFIHNLQLWHTFCYSCCFLSLWHMDEGFFVSFHQVFGNIDSFSFDFRLPLFAWGGSKLSGLQLPLQHQWNEALVDLFWCSTIRQKKIETSYQACQSQLLW